MSEEKEYNIQYESAIVLSFHNFTRTHPLTNLGTEEYYKEVRQINYHTLEDVIMGAKDKEFEVEQRKFLNLNSLIIIDEAFSGYQYLQYLFGFQREKYENIFPILSKLFIHEIANMIYDYSNKIHVHVTRVIEENFEKIDLREVKNKLSLWWPKWSSILKITFHPYDRPTTMNNSLNTINSHDQYHHCDIRSIDNSLSISTSPFPYLSRYKVCYYAQSPFDTVKKIRYF